MKLRILLAAAAAAAAALSAAPAGAGSSNKHQINSKDPIQLDSGHAYIFYRSTMKLPLLFLRDVTELEQRNWEAKREDAYRRARAKYEKALAQWQKDEHFYETASDVERMNFQKPVKPVEVTEEAFAFPPPELDNFLPVGAGPRVDEAGGDYDYLIAVEPGTYALYGNVILGANGAAVGTCLCMGSVKFEARPGQIVDLGEISFPRVESHDGDAMKVRGPRAIPSHRLKPASAALPLPPRLSGLPVVPADLHAADKVPNYFGIEIDRLPAIPGVLAYQRDRVIDEKAGAAPAAADGTGH